MEKVDEENELEPTGESNNSQETGEGGDTNNSDSSSDSSKQGNEFSENLSSESSSTVLVSENGVEEGENIQTGDQDREGIDQDETERAIEKELEEGVKVIDKYLEEEAEFIKAYQEIVAEARELNEERECEGEGHQMADEEWEKEVETAAYTAEQLFESMKKTEINTINEEIPENKEELEIEKEVEQSEEISEPQLSDLKEEVWGQDQELGQICKGKEPLEQHQVEPFIKEALETEQENITKEKELEKLQELDIEKQFQTVHLNEYVEELVEKQEEETEKLKEQEEKEELEAQARKIKEANFALYEVVEVERDMLDQHEIEPAIQEELEIEPESIFNEKELEKLQERDIEKQFQTVHLNEYVEELVERQEEDKNIENDKIKQEKENVEQTQDVIHLSTYFQKKLEEQEQELELEYKEKDIVEQHQVETAIEEELKTEPKPIVNEEELEYIKVLEPEKQLVAELFYEFIEELANKQNEKKEEREENEDQEEISTEQKVAQIMRELDIPQEINTSETEVETNSQEGELEQETTSPDEEVVEQLEIKEYEDHQQELEEILEQVRKIEQEALNEIEQEKEDLEKTIEKNYGRVKKLYKQQTGKRPIYANKETKGFKQWLEQKKKSEEKEKTKKKKGLKEEQKKEEDWKITFKEWIKEASEEECNAEFKSELKKALESYNEFEDLTRKYLKLYEKAQNEKLSEKEKNRLKSLTGRLHKLDPIQLELLISVFFIKKYITEQYWYDFWNKPLVNRVLSKFFKYISQKILKLKKAQENKENLEEIIRNWIEQASEGEISPELKVKLKEIVENYSKLEELATMFMKLYIKEQREKLSKHEKQELKVLTKTLQKLESGKIELFANIRAIKHFLNDQNFDEFSDKTHINRILSHFFKHISQKYEKLRKEQKNGKFKYLVNKKNYRMKKSFLESEDYKLLNKKSSIDPTEEKYSIRLKELTDKLFKYNRSIINKISKEFEIDILLHNYDNYLTGEFLDNVDKLTTEFLEYIYNKFQSYEKAVNYFIKLIAKNRTYDFALKYSKYISSSIIFYLFRINVITIKPIFRHFSFNTFKEIFSSEFNLDSFKKIFIEIYRNILNMNNNPPIFLTLTCEKTTLFNLNSYRYDVLRFLKIYHNIIFHSYQLDENDSFEKVSQLLYNLIKHCQDSLKDFYEIVNKTKPRLISASILFYFVQLKNPNLRFPEFASYLHIGERSLPKPVSLICNLLQSLPNADPINYHTIISYKGYQSLIKKYTEEFKIPKGEITPLEIFNDLLKSLKLEDLDLALEHIILKLKEKSLTRSPYHIFSVLSFMSYNYYCLSNQLKFLARKDFLEKFRLRNTSVQSLRPKVTLFIKLLLLNSDFVSKYSFLLSFVTGRYLDEIQYRYSLIYFCDIFLEQNTLLDFFEIRKENLKFIKSEILKIYDEMISRKNFSLFYQTLPKEVKNPKFVATFLIFFYFSYIKGYFIDIRFFLKLLEKGNIWKTFPINESKLYGVKKALIDSFFKKFTKQLFNNVMSKINFIHQGITYTFHPAISRLKIINPELSKGLYFLFLKIASDSFPNNFFNNPTYRPSDFMLKGNHSERLNFSTISQYFDKFIIKHRNFHGLSSEITKFISFFRNKYHKNPDHPPILNFIMKKYTKNAISTETPIWKSINEIENICGHIDLIIVFGNTLYICDYKPTLKEIYRKIPQLALYGNVIKSMLSRFCDISQFSIKCLGLCPNCALEFNTNIKYELMDFISSQNKIRRDANRMSTRNGQDLEESLKKAISFLERKIKDF